MQVGSSSAHLITRCSRWICTTCFPSTRAYATAVLARSDQLALSGDSSAISNRVPASVSLRRKRVSKNTTSEKLAKPKKTREPARNPLEPNAVDQHLNNISGTELPGPDELRRFRIEPYTMALHRLQNTQSSRKRQSSKMRLDRKENTTAFPEAYKEQYTRVVDSLLLSFSKDQLRSFCKELGLNLKGHRKQDYAETIVEENWKWSSPVWVEKDNRERTEIAEETIPVAPSELFLLLGKDGIELLRLSREFHAYIGLSSNPLALKIEGLKPSIDGLKKRIRSQRETFMDEKMQLPTKRAFAPELLQRVSRLAGTFVENVGESGEVRICARDLPTLNNAKRLITRAAYEIQAAPSPMLLSYLPVKIKDSHSMPMALFPDLYSFFPFFPPNALPWTMTLGGAFRIRRVAEWLGAEIHEDISRTGGLSGERGTIQSQSQFQVKVKDLLLGDRSLGTPDARKWVTASLGHTLFTIPSKAQRADITPPLQGSWPFPKILKWLQTSDAKTTFVPSLPSSLLSSAPVHERVLHRLEYHASLSVANTTMLSAVQNTAQDVLAKPYPSKTGLIRFETIIERPSNTNTAYNTPSSNLQGSSHDDLDADLDLPVIRAESSSLGRSRRSLDAIPPSDGQPRWPKIFGANDREVDARCWIGVESRLDLMMPDRPMDARFAVFECRSISSSEMPIELQDYAMELHAYLYNAVSTDATQPEPPLMLRINGEYYFLKTSASVRQGVDTVPSAPLPTSLSSIDLGEHDTPPIEIITESTLDLESNQRSTTCQVTYCDSPLLDNWQQFLVSCDKLSTSSYQTRRNRPQGSSALDLD